jgi:hypothetical protein
MYFSKEPVRPMTISDEGMKKRFGSLYLSVNDIIEKTDNLMDRNFLNAI